MPLGRLHVVIAHQRGRQSRAQQQRAAKGRPPRGIRATGYTLDGKLISDEAEAVKAVYQPFAHGSSLEAIAAALSVAEPAIRAVSDRNWVQDLPKSAPTLPSHSGRAWYPTSMIAILRSPRYAGWSMLAGEIVRDSTVKPVRGQWDPIVSDSLWLEVQRRVDDPARKTNRAGTERRYLGSGARPRPHLRRPRSCARTPVSLRRLYHARALADRRDGHKPFIPESVAISPE